MPIAQGQWVQKATTRAFRQQQRRAWCIRQATARAVDGRVKMAALDPYQLPDRRCCLISEIVLLRCEMVIARASSLRRPRFAYFAREYTVLRR